MTPDTETTCPTCGTALDGVTPGRFGCGATLDGAPCPEANRLAVYQLDALALASIFSTGRSSTLEIGQGVPKHGRLMGGRFAEGRVDLLVWAMAHDIVPDGQPLPTFAVLTRDVEPTATIIPFGKGARPS